MTGQKRAATKPRTSTKTADKSLDESIKYGPPLKPHPVLFVVLSFVLAVWLIALIVMRLRTVLPNPAAHTEPAPAVSR